MVRESGNISINTENIFPIIKKWLYSEKDIFIRELVSNSSDAISKTKKLVSMGEVELAADEEYTIKVLIDKKNKTIQVIDNGIGMTEDEVKKYINQIAFSGAKDFLEKYKDKTDDAQIIGHFGLGFYSSFMVSEKVRIDTLSYVNGAQAVSWTSSGGTEYEISGSDRTERGTTITLYMAEDSQEFLEEFKLREILKKYFSFLPYKLFLESIDEKEKDEETKTDEDAKKEPVPLNDTTPLWLKNPKDCTDEEYKKFYTSVFYDYNEPLFWIHLNMDYPFNIKGILYFPKLKHEFETMEGQIKLYYNQVFVADNIKEVIPEFLMLLKGMIDCPDLPLNVSRSFLQNDGYVNKISTHITKKVADKLISIFENNRDEYNKYWDDIHPFVKYGCIKEQKFFDRVKDYIIFKTTNGDYLTLKQYLERNNEKHKNQVFYVSDEKQQAQYIKLYKDNGMEAVMLSSLIDNHFMSFLETKESEIKFTRIDADISDNLKEQSEEGNEIASALEGIFKEVLSDDKLNIKAEALKVDSVAGMIVLSEQSRRMQEMSKMFGGMDMSMFPKDETLIINTSNSLIKKLYSLHGSENKKEDMGLICQHVYDMALMSHRQLDADAMTRFLERSNKILEKLAQN